MRWRSSLLMLVMIVVAMFAMPQRSEAQAGYCTEPYWGWCIELQGDIEWWAPWGEYEYAHIEGPFCCWAEEFEVSAVYWGYLTNPGQLVGVSGARWVSPPLGDYFYLGCCGGEPAPFALDPFNLPLLSFGTYKPSPFTRG